MTQDKSEPSDSSSSKRRKTKHPIIIEICGVHGDDVKEIVEDLANKDLIIREFRLRFSEIGEAGAVVIAGALSDKSSLQVLDLGFDQIGEAGAVAIAGALSDKSSLQELDLDGNKIGDTGVAALAGVLAIDGCSIQELRLGYNKITDTGVAALSKVLKTNSSVEVLNLRANEIGDTGLAALAGVLAKDGCSIQQFILGSDKITNTGVAALAEVLKTNPRLQHLELEGNGITDEGVAALAEVLELPNCCLKTVVLKSKKITEAGEQALLRALHTNRSVTQLTLWGTGLWGNKSEASARQKIKEELLETNHFLNSLPPLGKYPSNFLEYNMRCSTLRDRFLQTRAKYGISMLGQSSKSVPNKISNFLSELEGEMLGTYGAFEVELAKSKDATIAEKKTAFIATTDMLQCLLKPGELSRPLERCIRYLIDGQVELMMEETPLQLLSYRLLLEAASEVKAKLPPALQESVATLLQQKDYHSETAGKLMAIPEVMSCLGMNPVIASGAAVASLDVAGTQPILIDCYVREGSLPVVFQAAIITEESLVSSNPSLAGLGMFDSSPASSDEKEEKPPKPKH